MNEFIEKFKQAKIHELLKIVNESDKHSPEAVESAKSELANRGINSTELQKIISQLSHRDRREEVEPLEVEYTRNTATGTETIIIDAEDPLEQRKRSIDSQILVLSILFGLISINNFTSSSSLLKHFFAANATVFNLDSVTYLLLLFMLPMGIFTFWLRYRIGWIILTIYTVCSIIMSVCLIAVSFDWMIFDLFYVMGSPLQYILSNLLYLILFYVLWIVDLRIVLRISKRLALAVTIGTALVAILMMYITF